MPQTRLPKGLPKDAGTPIPTACRCGTASTRATGMRRPTDVLATNHFGIAITAPILLVGVPL